VTVAQEKDILTFALNIEGSGLVLHVAKKQGGQVIGTTQ
jgi:hypothetical protein